MRCEICSEQMDGLICACGWKAPELATKPTREWRISECAGPGCFVVIREPADRPPGHPLCKWCQRRGVVLDVVA